LTTLNLKWNQIGDQGASYLADVLYENEVNFIFCHTIESFNISV